MLVSEYPPGEAPLAYRFIERNRIMSGISRGVLIVEAPESSGALATARYAVEQNRDVFVVPGAITSTHFTGSHALIRQGAELVTSPDDILDAYDIDKKKMAVASAGASSPEETLILKALADISAPADVDKLIALTKLEPRVVNQALSFLLLRGIIKETDAGYTIEIITVTILEQMDLIIVESPTKAKTIGKFVGKDFTVESSYGHIRDLPKSKIGIDVEHDFAPSYIIPTKAEPVVANLKALAKKADKVILATDEDREGEAIAWHLVNALGLDEKKTARPYERIAFHEITKNAIMEALEHPRALDMNLVDAQQARRVLDRLVGYDSRRSSGARSATDFPPGACRAWRCGSSWNANA